MSLPDHEALLDWAEILDDSNYYELLGVLQIADDVSIKRAFHEFALAFHPDSHVGAAEETCALARTIFRRGAEAYRVLGDPALRAKYDLQLARGFLRMGAEQHGVPPRAPVANPAVRSLEELCSSPAAKRLARRAESLIATGDLLGARRSLNEALAQEGGDNEELETRIDDLDLALFASGG